MTDICCTRTFIFHVTFVSNNCCKSVQFNNKGSAGTYLRWGEF